MTLGSLGKCRQCQLPSVPCLGPPGMSYKAIYRWLLHMLGLEVHSVGQAVNQGWLLLVLDLGPLSKGYMVYRGQMLLV